MDFLGNASYDIVIKFLNILITENLLLYLLVVSSITRLRVILKKLLNYKNMMVGVQRK